MRFLDFDINFLFYFTGKRLRTIKSSSPVRKYITRRTLLEKIDQEKNIKDTKVNESKCDSSDDLDKIKDSILKCNEQKGEYLTTLFLYENYVLLCDHHILFPISRKII